VEIPGPLAAETLDFEGRSLPVYIFEGITQVIAADIPPDKKTFLRIQAGIEAAFSRSAAGQPAAAVGVMFYDTAAGFMRPAVYVYGTDSLVFESSCGSGSAALGVWLTQGQGDGNGICALRQPGGIIEVQVRRGGGGIEGITIGGPVDLSGRIYRSYPAV
jgi:hypothetical protein